MRAAPRALARAPPFCPRPWRRRGASAAAAAAATPPPPPERAPVWCHALQLVSRLLSTQQLPRHDVGRAATVCPQRAYDFLRSTDLLNKTGGFRTLKFVVSSRRRTFTDPVSDFCTKQYQLSPGAEPIGQPASSSEEWRRTPEEKPGACLQGGRSGGLRSQRRSDAHSSELMGALLHFRRRALVSAAVCFLVRDMCKAQADNDPHSRPPPSYSGAALHRLSVPPIGRGTTRPICLCTVPRKGPALMATGVCRSTSSPDLPPW